MSGYKATSFPPLAQGKVRYTGEAVAIVVAESRCLAEDAAERIVVEYEPLPPVGDMEAALAAGAPVLHETGHIDPDFWEANREKILQAYPIRRLGRPGDIAPAVAFLTSDLASWITGQTLSISGGYTTAQPPQTRRSRSSCSCWSRRSRSYPSRSAALASACRRSCLVAFSSATRASMSSLTASSTRIGPPAGGSGLPADPRATSDHSAPSILP